MQNYYSLLEISESASQDEIKIAFKRLALLYHPDKHQGDESMAEKFKEINQAYQTLSNPYEKARYDIKITYGRQTQAPYQEPTYHRAPQRAKKYRREYVEPKVDWKENWRATLYAFGFTFVVASVVMTAFFIRDFYNEKKHIELLAKRREVFDEAKSKYKLGMIEDALTSFNSLDPHLKEEKDMSDYKAEVFESLIDKGEKNYYDLQFENAIYYYEIIERFSPRKPIPLKEHLAKSYQFTNRPKAAIKVFTELLINGYRHLDCYLTIGEIYRDQLDDDLEAERYLTLARELSIKQYRSIYGKAYFLVISGEHLPAHHYRLYTGLANIYLDLKKYEKAIKTTEWNTQVWPDSAENYAVAAKGYLALNEMTEACENFRIASTLGYNGTVQIDCSL